MLDLTFRVALKSLSLCPRSQLLELERNVFRGTEEILDSCIVDDGKAQARVGKK